MSDNFNPSWKQLGLVHDCLMKQQILDALGVTPPDAGVSSMFVLKEGVESVSFDGQAFVYYKQGVSHFCYGDEVLKWSRAPKGTPTGDALRVWLRRHGWLPKSERDVMDAQKDTKVVV